MAGHNRPQFQPLVLVASATTPINTPAIGGLFCTGAGTFTINGLNEQGVLTQIVSFAGIANTWYDLPFFIGSNGGNVVTGAGATGTLAT
jgi:S-formylglutathione hydrolase FrmB